MCKRIFPWYCEQVYVLVFCDFHSSQFLWLSIWCFLNLVIYTIYLLQISSIVLSHRGSRLLLRPIRSHTWNTTLLHLSSNSALSVESLWLPISDFLQTHHVYCKAFLLLHLLLIHHRFPTFSSTLPALEPESSIASNKISVIAVTSRLLPNGPSTSALPVPNFLQLLILFLAFIYFFNWAVLTYYSGS